VPELLLTVYTMQCGCRHQSVAAVIVLWPLWSLNICFSRL